LALFHFCIFFYPQEEFQLVIDIGLSETSIFCIAHKTPLFFRALSFGLAKLDIEALQKLDETNSPELDVKLADLHLFLREIVRVLLSLEALLENNGSGVVKDMPLLFTGAIVNNLNLVELFRRFLNRNLAMPAKMPANLLVPAEYSWDSLRAFAAPLGAALSLCDKLSPKYVADFRQEELTFAGKWGRWKKELTVYFLLMVALSAAFFGGVYLRLTEKRKALVERYITILALLEKSPDDIEKACGNVVSEKAFDPYKLDLTELEERLFAVQKVAQTSQEEMALHPDVPRVSDVLNWLTTHPQILVSTNAEQQNIAPIKLESLTYTMVKRPEKGRSKERYQVRVDLEFSSESTTRARELHDALLAPNDFVDPKSELKWSTQRGHFCASFILKDRTRYP
jgi:hypothetical protein